MRNTSRRDILRGASALPLLSLSKARATADILYNPQCPIDASALFRMHDNLSRQWHLNAAGSWDNDLALQFANDASDCWGQVSEFMLGMICSARPFVTDGNNGIPTPDKSALVTELAGMWGLAAPDGFLLDPAAQHATFESTQAMLYAPFVLRAFIAEYTDALKAGVLAFPLPTTFTPSSMMRPNFAPGDPDPDQPPDQPPPPSPPPSGNPFADWGANPPTLPQPPYTVGDSMKVWGAGIAGGTALAGLGVQLITLAGNAAFVAALGASAPAWIVGGGIALFLLGAYVIGKSTYNIVYIGSHMQGSKPNFLSPALAF